MRRAQAIAPCARRMVAYAPCVGPLRDGYPVAERSGRAPGHCFTTIKPVLLDAWNRHAMAHGHPRHTERRGHEASTSGRQLEEYIHVRVRMRTTAERLHPCARPHADNRWKTTSMRTVRKRTTDGRLHPCVPSTSRRARGSPRPAVFRKS